jgi:hypothetical protein
MNWSKWKLGLETITSKAAEKRLLTLDTLQTWFPLFDQSSDRPIFDRCVG